MRERYVIFITGPLDNPESRTKPREHLEECPEKFDAHDTKPALLESRVKAKTARQTEEQNAAQCAGHEQKYHNAVYNGQRAKVLQNVLVRKKRA